MAKTAIRLQNNMAGLTGVGTAATSVRFWAGSSTPESAPFRVTQNGMAYMSGGKIGYFEIMNNRLVWEGRDYFGDTSRTINLDTEVIMMVWLMSLSELRHKAGSG